MVSVNKQNNENKEDKKHKSLSNVFDLEEFEKEVECSMRVGKAYQAEVPPMIPSSEQQVKSYPEKALLVWCPNNGMNDKALEEYVWLARDKYCYNAEQALGMLFWHRHDVDKATRDLANFTPYPDEWTTEDKVLFEQAFQFHGKSFQRIRQMLPDKSVPQLVKYYYLWKKTRQKSSLIDKHARKHAAKLEGSDPSQLAAGDHSDDEEESSNSKGNEDPKVCSNCTVPANVLSDTPKGSQCTTCYNHWKRVGSLRPTIGPMKRDRNIIKHKRRPPKGMYINHEDLIAMVSTDSKVYGECGNGNKILKHMENEIVALKIQVQNNKAQLSAAKVAVGSDTIQSYRPTQPSAKLNAKWSNDEALIAVQGIRQYGKNFQSIADIVGNKSANHVRSFFVSHRKRYNLDSVLKEWEEEYGPCVETSQPEESFSSTSRGIKSY